MKSPDSSSQKPENPKPEGNPSEPFRLEITPEKLVVPPDETLEVKILNPEKEKCVVEAYLDSFFFLMKAIGEEYVKNVGDSISTILVQKELEPNESLNLSVGYFNGEYTVKNICEKSWHREEDKPGLGDNLWVEKVEVVKAAPSERIYYNQDRPEGHLTVSYYKRKKREWRVEEDDLPTVMLINEPGCRILETKELYLENETEPYRIFREQFEKVKKDQKIRARWGHVLANEEQITKRKFTSDSGVIQDLHKKGDSEGLVFWIDSEDGNRGIPKKLEEIDKMTDEEIKNFKSRKREGAVKEKEEREKRWKVETENKKKAARLEMILTREDEIEEKDEDDVKKVEKAVKPPPESKVSEAQKPGLQTVKTAEENVQKAPEPTVSKAGKPRPQKVETAESKVQKPTKTADKKKGNNNKKKNPCCSIM